MDWIEISQLRDIDNIKEQSTLSTCIIFKHSTRCAISSIAKIRFEEASKASLNDVQFYHLDLIRYRRLSNQIAETFQVTHESPQILVILNEQCVFDASHLDINLNEVAEELDYISKNG